MYGDLCLVGQHDVLVLCGDQCTGGDLRFRGGGGGGKGECAG